MKPLQPLISTTRQVSNRVRQGVPIPPFTSKSIFSKAKHNEVLAVVNALANPKVDPPSAGKISISDVDITYTLRGGSSSGSGSGNLNYRGLYSSGEDYSVDDVVYVGATPATRYLYICEIDNGISTAVHAPDPAEASTIYWRLASGGGVHYRGTYANANAYAVGDIVRVRSGTSQGIWICVIAQSALGTAPVYPEPADSGGTNKWEMFAFGINTLHYKDTSDSCAAMHFDVNSGAPTAG